MIEKHSTPNEEPWSRLPWSLTPSGAIVDADGALVGTTHIDTDDHADAALIVTAVNSHDELLEALRWMLGVAEARNCDPRARTVNLKFTRLTLNMWQEKARAAIAEAEGGAR